MKLIKSKSGVSYSSEAVVWCKNNNIVGNTDVEKRRKRVRSKVFCHIFLYSKMISLTTIIANTSVFQDLRAIDV